MEAKSRQLFLQHVIAILALQLVATLIIIVIFNNVVEVKGLLIWDLDENSGAILCIIFYIFLMSYNVLQFFDESQLTLKFVFLVLVTLSLSFIAAIPAVMFGVEKTTVSGLIVTPLTILIVVYLAICSKLDLTKFYLAFQIFSFIVCTFIAFFCLTSKNIENYVNIVIVPIIFLVCTYLFLDMQRIVGGRAVEIPTYCTAYTTSRLFFYILVLFVCTLLVKYNDDYIV